MSRKSHSRPRPFPVCLVRGSGDVGSAVAHALWRQGLAVAIHDVPAPGYARRGMAFVDALFDEGALLEGVLARRVADGDTLQAMALRGRALPVFCGALDEALDGLLPDVLVDARMRKREAPEPQRGLAALTVGLGPGFVAGGNVDLAVETAWGDTLGEVVREGCTLALAGEPRMILGHSRARFVYAPAAGTIESTRRIGDGVRAGDLLARLGAHALRASFDGVLVGLTRPGVEVRAGAKVIEVDPRGERALAFGIATRGRTIAAGVLRAVQAAFAREMEQAAAMRLRSRPRRIADRAESRTGSRP